jgi:hypothetical protein
VKTDFFDNLKKKAKIESLGRDEFGLTKTYFSENIQKIKFFNFFRKKVITQKNELCSYLVPLFV